MCLLHTSSQITVWFDYFMCLLHTSSQITFHFGFFLDKLPPFIYGTPISFLRKDQGEKTGFPMTIIIPR
jgi:hypothetical protein